MRRGFRWAGWIIGSLLILFVGIPAIAVAIFALFFTWNDARPVIARVASGVLDRKVNISGDLNVDLGRVTQIKIQGLSIDNAPWGRADHHLLRVGDLVISIALPPLLSGNVDIPSLAIADMQANLERNEQGRGNWPSGNAADGPAKPSGGSGEAAKLPLVESLSITKTRVTFDDRQAKKQVTLVVDRLKGGEDGDRRRMTVDGSGSYQGQPAKLQAVMGSLDALKQHEKAYPLDVTMSAGDFRLRVNGTIDDPQTLQGPNLALEVGGDNLTNLFPLTGIPIPPSPPYHLSGRLERQGTAWAFENFAGKLGDSDMRGKVAVDFAGKRPRIKGDVVSTLLDLKDLAGFIGASEGGPNAQIETREGGRVLPDKKVDLTKLRSVDVDIHFTGTRIVTPQVPIDKLDAKVALDAGTFRVQPATFAVGDGNVNVYLSLYGAEEPVRSDIKAVIEHVDLRRLMRGSDFVSKSFGSFNGRAELSAMGTSVADIAGSATGDVMVVLADGRISRLLVELMGLDVFESLGILVSGDESIPIRCIVADFDAQKGLFQARTLVFDTTDTNVIGTGTMNMRDEALNLRLHAYPKDFSPFTLRTPISVQGTLGHPDAFPDPADIGVEGGAKKVLNSVLTLVEGLLPPPDIGPGKNAPCGDLIARARRHIDAKNR